MLPFIRGNYPVQLESWQRLYREKEILSETAPVFNPQNFENKE